MSGVRSRSIPATFHPRRDPCAAHELCNYVAKDKRCLRAAFHDCPLTVRENEILPATSGLRCLYSGNLGTLCRFLCRPIVYGRRFTGGQKRTGKVKRISKVKANFFSQTVDYGRLKARVVRAAFALEAIMRVISRFSRVSAINFAKSCRWSIFICGESHAMANSKI